MNCQEAIIQAKNYWHGELSIEQGEEIDLHLDKCESCQHEFDTVLQSDKNLQTTLEKSVYLETALKSMFTFEQQRQNKSMEKLIKNLLPPENTLLWAACDKSSNYPIQEKMGIEFEKINPIDLDLGYQGNLYFLKQDSAILEITHKKQTSTQLDAKKIEFYLQNNTKVLTTAMVKNVAIIDFSSLGIPISDFLQVHFKIYMDENTIIKGNLGQEES